MNGEPRPATGATESEAFFRSDLDERLATGEMLKYADVKQELDKLLEAVITPHIAGTALSILDACCGVGHLTRLLATISPESELLGVDSSPRAIEHALDLCTAFERASFETGDIIELARKRPKAFDISVSWKTLSWLAAYEPMLEALFALTRSQIFLSSLFYDGDIDFDIRVRENRRASAREGFTSRYNVYSLPRFEAVARRLGAREVEVRDFEIGIDLPKPPPDQMGTYTISLEDGRRLQVSGAVIMSWKVIRLGI